MKKLFLCAAALLAAISFPACSDSEDDGQNIDKSKLLGRWVAIALYNYDAKSDSYVEEEFGKEVYVDDFVLNFQDEKTVLISYSEESEPEYSSPNTYTLKGSKVTFHDIESDYRRSYTITGLTDTQLELWKKDIDNNFKVIYERKAVE